MRCSAKTSTCDIFYVSSLSFLLNQLASFFFFFNLGFLFSEITFEFYVPNILQVPLSNLLQVSVEYVSYLGKIRSGGILYFFCFLGVCLVPCFCNFSLRIRHFFIRIPCKNEPGTDSSIFTNFMTLSNLIANL